MNDTQRAVMEETIIDEILDSMASAVTNGNELDKDHSQSLRNLAGAYLSMQQANLTRTAPRKFTR